MYISADMFKPNSNKAGGILHSPHRLDLTKVLKSAGAIDILVQMCFH